MFSQKRLKACGRELFMYRPTDVVVVVVVVFANNTEIIPRVQEKTKVKALSEELENPMNVHRWRKLEGSDPATFEMIQKIHTLQKRLISKTEEVREDAKQNKTKTFCAKEGRNEGTGAVMLMPACHPMLPPNSRRERSVQERWMIFSLSKHVGENSSAGFRIVCSLSICCCTVLNLAEKVSRCTTSV